VTRITVLTTANCDLCEQAQQTLARLGDELGDLAVEIVDLGSPRGRQLATDAGIVFPPGVLIDGRPFSYGRLSERKLRRALSGHPIR
jgi:glutaredoxin